MRNFEEERAGEFRGMIEISQKYAVRCTEIEKEEYPRRLRTITSAPKVLYYSGDISVINQNQGIAVVGSRRVSDKGIEIAYRIGYELGRRGVNVINGLALGCDTHALHGALAAGGRCVAVMPCGLERTVPYSNRRLAEKIVTDGGCLVSEYPPLATAQRYQYVQRDRLQSGISDGVLVVEADCDSGTMHTVQYAIKQGRRLACVDSRLVGHASGNQWIEGQSGVRVIQDAGDLNLFMAEIHSEPVYRQMQLEA